MLATSTTPFNQAGFRNTDPGKQYNNWLKVQYMNNQYASKTMVMAGEALRRYIMKSTEKDTPGDEMRWPIQTSGSQSHSSDIKVSQTLAGSAAGMPTVDTFKGFHSIDFTVDMIQYEDWLTGKGNMKAFTDQRSFQLDNTFREFGVRIASALFSPGWHVVGVVTATSGKTVTLTSADEVNSIGQRGYYEFWEPKAAKSLEPKVAAASQRAGGTAVTDVSTSAYTVDSINLQLNTGTLNPKPIITFTETIGAAVAVGDLLIKAGDGPTGGKHRRFIAGFPQWNPVTAPGSDRFFDLVRNKAPETLAGLRQSLTSNADDSLNNSIDALITQSNVLANGGGSNEVWMHPYTERAMINRLTKQADNLTTGSRVYFDVNPANRGGQDYAISGFSTLVFNSSHGKHPVVVDRFVPVGQIRGMNWNYVMPKHISEEGKSPVHIIKEADFRLRESSNNYETRIALLSQLGITCPAAFWVLDVSALTDFWSL